MRRVFTLPLPTMMKGTGSLRRVFGETPRYTAASPGVSSPSGLRRGFRRLGKRRARHVHEQRRRTDLRPVSDEIERDKRDVIPLMFGEVLLTIIHQWPLLFRSLSVPAPPYGPSGHVQPFERRPHLPLGRGFRFPISPRAFVLRVPLDERGDHLARPPF